MSDNKKAGSSTANTHSTNPNSTTNGDNMSYFDKLKEHLDTRTANKLVKLNLVDQHTLLEVVESSGQGFDGIGPKTCEAIKTAMNLVVVEDEVEVVEPVGKKLQQIRRSVKTKVSNLHTYGMRTNFGTQSQTVVTKSTGVVPALVMDKSFAPGIPEMISEFGYVPESKNGKAAQLTIKEGQTLSDFVKVVIGKDRYEDEKTRRKFIAELKRINHGLRTGVQKQTLSLKMPSHGNDSWVLANFGLHKLLGGFLPSATRQREYSRFLKTTHSLEVGSLKEYLVMPYMIFSGYKAMREFNKTLIDKETGLKLQEMSEVLQLPNGWIVAERWNDGQHWLSKDASKLVGADILSMGRTINGDGFAELSTLQNEVNNVGSILENSTVEFYSNLNKAIRGEAIDEVFQKKLCEIDPDLYQAVKNLQNKATQDNKNKVKVNHDLMLADLFREFAQVKLKQVPVVEDTTFSKGTYLVPQKNEFVLEGTSVGIYYKDIKSKNKKKHIAAMHKHILELYNNDAFEGRCNQPEEFYAIVPTGKETLFSLLKNIEVGSSSWGHQLLMWYKSWSGSFSEEAKKKLAKAGVDSAESFRDYMKTLCEKAMEYRWGSTDLADIAMNKTKGSLANEASKFVFDEMGADWLGSPEGQETFQTTFESVCQDLFKGKAFRPDRSTFIAPNIHWALKMAKAGVVALLPIPEHLKGCKNLKEVVMALLARYPSNTSDNPVHGKALLKNWKYSILAIGVIELLVADVDGDEVTSIIEFDASELKGKKKLLQEVWNMLVAISVEKKSIIKSRIEDVAPIDVTKTVERFTRNCDPVIAKIVLDAVMYPNQAAVGPVANHIQTISILDLMSDALMVILGALLQNTIDTQKSLNDFYWLIKHNEIQKDDEGYLTFPAPSKWTRLTLPEIKKVLLSNPSDWRGKKCHSYMGFSPEILLPVGMKEELMKIPYMSNGDASKDLFWVELPYQAQDEDGSHIEGKGWFLVHPMYFHYFKANSPYMPGIQAITHWIKFQIGFPEGYSQSATPWHNDSTGKFDHQWGTEYCSDISLKSKYSTAGSTSLVSAWYETVKEVSEKSWHSLEEPEDCDFWDLGGSGLTGETKVWLNSFEVGGVNAYTSSNVDKERAKEVATNFVEATKCFVFLDNTMKKKKFLLNDLLRMGLDSTNKARYRLIMTKIDADFFQQDILPFGVEWNLKDPKHPKFEQVKALREKYGEWENKTYISLKARGADQDEIDTVVLGEAASWVAIKRRLQSVFEFFAAQTLPSACPVWMNTKKELQGASRDNWEEVYHFLSIQHDNTALHKCPSCYREFLKWKGGTVIQTSTQRFGDTAKFLCRISNLPSRAIYYGLDVENMPKWMQKHVKPEEAEYEVGAVTLLNKDDYLLADIKEIWKPEEEDKKSNSFAGFGFDFNI